MASIPSSLGISSKGSGPTIARMGAERLSTTMVMFFKARGSMTLSFVRMQSCAITMEISSKGSTVGESELEKEHISFPLVKLSKESGLEISQ